MRIDLDVRIDAMGNTFGRRAGAEESTSETRVKGWIDGRAAVLPLKHVG